MEWNRMLEALRWLRKYFMSRTLLEQFLIVISLILFFSFIILLLIVATRKNAETEIKEDTVCITEGCMKYATSILEKLDPSISPCDDFYEFACGSYSKHHTLSEGKRAHKVEDDVESEIYAILRSLLASHKHFRNRSFKNAKSFYKCCMEGTDEFDGISDLIQQILKSSDIQWSSAISDREWKSAIVNMILYGSYPYYDISLDVKHDDILAKLDRPQPGTKQTLLSEFAFEYSIGEYRQIQKDYINLIESTMLLTERSLNAQRLQNEDENCTNLLHMAEEFYRLEKYLIQELPCSISRQTFRKSVCSTMKDETKWVAAFVDQVIPRDMSGYRLDVTCNCLNYVDAIDGRHQGNRVFRYYALWRHLARYLPLVSSSFRHSYMRLYEALNPVNKGITSYREARYFSEKWKQCVHLTNEAYGLVLAQIYTKEDYNDEADDNEIVTLVDSILKVYAEMFASKSSLKNATIADVLEKVETLVIDINYPDIILDEFSLEDYYIEKSEHNNGGCNPVKQVQHPKSCFIYGLLKNECMKVKNDLLHLWYKQLNGSAFAYIPPVSSRVHVDLERSRMALPVGMMRFPYYTPNFFKFAKYAGISALIIHELSQKIQADLLEDGDSSDIVSSYSKECLLKHIKSFSDKVSQVISERNWEEVILDNIALRVAYELYQRDESEQSEPNLPNLDYNSDQLFFIHYAQMYCEIRNNTFSKFDRSIPAKFRVNNVMMNNKEFSEAFECSEESPMNPNDKCSVWE